MTEQTYAVTADELRQFIEVAEQLASEKANVSEREKDNFAEAKARGYCVQTLKVIISLRKKSKDEIDERDAILELYKSAIGM